MAETHRFYNDSFTRKRHRNPCESFGDKTRRQAYSQNLTKTQKKIVFNEVCKANESFWLATRSLKFVTFTTKSTLPINKRMYIQSVPFIPKPYYKSICNIWWHQYNINTRYFVYFMFVTKSLKNSFTSVCWKCPRPSRRQAHALLNASRTRANNFDAKLCLTINMHRTWMLRVPPEKRLCKWCERRSSVKDVLDSSITSKAGGVYYTKVDLLLTLLWITCLLCFAS
jgi:hypothetical protein